MPVSHRVAVGGAVVVVAAVTVVSLAPSASAAADRTLASLGAPAFPYDWGFHFAAWAAVGYTVARTARRSGRRLTVAVLAVAAVAVEAAQSGVPGRTVEAADLAANLAGAAVGYWAVGYWAATTGRRATNSDPRMRPGSP